MQREQTLPYTTEVGGADGQIQFVVYADPAKSPWGSWGGDAIVANIVSLIEQLGYVQRAFRGHVTRGTLHLYINLTEGTDRSSAADDINGIVARFFE